MAAVSEGLEHVTMGRSTIAYVGGEEGALVYRGYPIAALVPGTTYEAVVELLLRGHAPPTSRPEALRAELGRRRVLDAGSLALVDDVPTDRAPLDALRSIVSLLGPADLAYPPTEAQGVALIGGVPTALARFVRRKAGQEPVPPDPARPHAEDYLRMLTGRVPDPARVHALEDYLVLLADHGMNASTFALRVVLSTNSDFVSAVTAAIGALKGPAHGGAPSKVSDMLDAVGDPSAAEAWVNAALARGDRLFGFGHRAYKTDDPRGLLLHDIARSIAEPRRFALAEAVETAALAALRREKPGRRLYTNVEFYSAVVLEAVGLPRALFTPTFAVARTAGWAAHALEQAADNRLIRPDVEYIGPRAERWPLPRGWSDGGSA